MKVIVSTMEGAEKKEEGEKEKGHMILTMDLSQYTL